MFLLAAYIALALSRADERTAVRRGVVLTAVVLVAVGVKTGAL
jgi:hypothetical protein